MGIKPAGPQGDPPPEGKVSFYIKKNGNLQFKIVDKSTDGSVLFYIKNELGRGCYINIYENIVQSAAQVAEYF